MIAGNSLYSTSIDNGWIAVSKDAFYATVGKLDVHPSIQPGAYPYTSLWKLRSGQVVGKSVGRRVNPAEVVDDYYVRKD